MNKDGAPEKTVTLSSTGGSAQIIGPYHLLQKIGEGGMGEVWVAEQHKPIHRRLALKLIKAGMDTRQVIARFESERQALAMMDHPAIAKVFEAGETAQGRPYFVMEYVQGIPITTYCDQNRLTTQERLGLFKHICEGVQHAHQKAIIHRDLKPSNILVAIQDGKPVPKIIDFGVAKATAQSLTERTMYTELGMLIGTPEYMSPEQAEMSGLNVDTRTDVYSLGAILYELMTGALPFDPNELRCAGFDEIRRKIREEDPPKPSTKLSTMGEASTVSAQNRRTEPPSLVRQIKGDLDWITMKALEKDRTRRYGSPSDLAADIDRYLHNQPIVARPPSTAYKAKKFVRRHRVGVGVASVLAILLVAFSVTMAIQTRRIAKERIRAEAEAAKAVAINAFLLETLGSANPIEGNSRDVTILEALKSATKKIDKAFTGQPIIQGEVQQIIGVTYLRLGHYEEAETLLRSALRILEETLDRDQPALVPALNSLGVLRQERGDYAEAEALQRRALAIQRKKYGDENPDVLSIQGNLALLLQDMGKNDEAADLMRQNLAADRKIWGSGHLNVAIDLNNLGNLLLKSGNTNDSEPLLREAVAILKKENHPALFVIMANLGDLISKKGDAVAAESILAEAVASGLKNMGDQNQDVAKARGKYGACLTQLKKYDSAEVQFLAALPILDNSLGPKDRATQQVIRNLVELYENWGKPEKASVWNAKLSPVDKK